MPERQADPREGRHFLRAPLGPSPYYRARFMEPDAPIEDVQFDYYKLVRDEIAHEDNLMGSRLSWFAALQSFLITALAIAEGGKNRLPSRADNAFFPLIPLIAIGSTVLILCGVVGGIITLIRWRRILAASAAAYPLFPRVVKDAAIIRLGWAAPAGLPLIFLFAWMYLLVTGLRASP